MRGTAEVTMHCKILKSFAVCDLILIARCQEDPVLRGFIGHFLRMLPAEQTISPSTIRSFAFSIT